MVIFFLPFLTVFQCLTGRWTWGAGLRAAAQYAVARIYGKRVRQVTRSIGSVQGDLNWLAEVLVFAAWSGEKFQSERLRRMDDAACQCDGNVAASQAIQPSGAPV